MELATTVSAEQARRARRAGAETALDAIDGSFHFVPAFRAQECQLLGAGGDQAAHLDARAEPGFRSRSAVERGAIHEVGADIVVPLLR